MLKTYYELTKPGIIYGNAITAAAGFFLAAAGQAAYARLAFMLVGLSLVIASGCVFNNYLDRDIDARMERTKGRALVSGAVSPRVALVYGAVLGAVGFAVLALCVNALSADVAAIGFVAYVLVYSWWAKRTTPYATHLGAIAGAVPPVVGYAAAAGRLDAGALILFLMLCAWQMPHFFAIALYRQGDYRAAGVPALPLVRSLLETKLQIAGFIALFIFASYALFARGYAGPWYLLASLVLGIFWFLLALSGFGAVDVSRWARRVFFASLFVLLGVCLAMALNARRPRPPRMPAAASVAYAAAYYGRA